MRTLLIFQFVFVWLIQSTTISLLCITFESWKWWHWTTLFHQIYKIQSTCMFLLSIFRICYIQLVYFISSCNFHFTAIFFLHFEFFLHFSFVFSFLQVFVDCHWRKIFVNAIKDQVRDDDFVWNSCKWIQHNVVFDIDIFHWKTNTNKSNNSKENIRKVHFNYFLKWNVEWFSVFSVIFPSEKYNI